MFSNMLSLMFFRVAGAFSPALKRLEVRLGQKLSAMHDEHDTKIGLLFRMAQPGMVYIHCGGIFQNGLLTIPQRKVVPERQRRFTNNGVMRVLLRKCGHMNGNAIANNFTMTPVRHCSCRHCLPSR